MYKINNNDNAPALKVYYNLARTYGTYVNLIFIHLIRNLRLKILSNARYTKYKLKVVKYLYNIVPNIKLKNVTLAKLTFINEFK